MVVGADVAFADAPSVTAVLSSSQATVGETDRAAYRDYVAAREVAWRQKLKSRRAAFFR